MMKQLLPLMTFLTLVSTASRADDSPLPLAVLRIEAAVQAKCLPKLASATEIFQKHNLKWVGGGSESKSIVAGLLQEIDRLHGSVFMPFSSFAVEVNPDYDIAGRQVYDSRLNMAKIVVAEPENVALFIHEMGHVMGNAPYRGLVPNGRPYGSWYAAYNAAVPNPCHATQYAKTGSNLRPAKRNEEFAEIVSAFFTRPQLLKNGSASCRKAYDFLTVQAFPSGTPKCLPAPAAPKPAPVPKPAPAPVAPGDRDEIVCTDDEGLVVRDATLAEILFRLAPYESVVRDDAAGKRQREVEGEKIDYIHVSFADGDTDGWVAERYIRERKQCAGAPAAPPKEEPSQQPPVEQTPPPVTPPGVVLESAQPKPEEIPPKIEMQ